MDPTGDPGRSTWVYKQLIATEADKTLRLMSATDGSSTSFYLQLNRLLVEILDTCVQDMIDSPGVLRLPPKAQQKLLKEFYRAMKEATNLVRLCCNQESWLMTAFCMVDSRETFALRCSELLWFKRVVGSYEIGQELDWKLRWETALVEDRSQLQENVKKIAQDTSTKESHLARNLSRRLEVTQETTDPLAQNHVVYLDLEGLNVHEDKPLGKGATAEVYKATWRGEVFAVKKFWGCNSKLAAVEASIATEVHHPNIVPMLGRLQVQEGTDGFLMELMSSSLLSYMQAMKSRSVWWFTFAPFQPLVVVDMMLQIAEAMRYLHEKNIAHLDLKAENILVNLISDSYLAQDGYVNLKLVDFGCSRINVNSSTTLYEPYLGTTLYRAPEIRTGKYTRCADIYGFALISYQIMTGNEPFPKPESYREFNEKVRNGDRPKWRLIDPYPSSLKTLIEECWSGDALKRPAFASICKRLRGIKGFLITGSYDGVEELPMREDLMDPASQEVVHVVVHDFQESLEPRIIKDRHGIVMELMSLSLLSYVQAMKSRNVWWFTFTPFQPLVAIDMMLQIAEAMRYLHEENIAHLDLKTENILVKLNSNSYLAQEGYANLKVIDFRYARINVKSSTSLYEPYVGTTLYRAPEIRTGKYTRSADIYGFALVSYQIMTGNEPFSTPKSYREFNEKVRNGDKPKWRLIDPYPSSLKILIEECWSVDPLKRPAFASICKRLRCIEGFLITGSYDGVEELPTHEDLMDPASQEGLEHDMQGPISYLKLSQNVAERVFHLKSGLDEHRSSSTDVSSLLKSPHLNKMQCDLLVQYLGSSMDEVNKQMSSNPKSVSGMTLTEFYRIVIGCEKLILQCCNPNWQTAAIWVMDCKSTFLLRISELLWCSAIIANTTWQDAAFTERIDEISRKLSDYAEKDRSQLKDMLLEVSTVVDSRYVRGDLVTYLSQRADARGGEVVECAPHLWFRERIIIGVGSSSRVCKEIMFNESVAIKVWSGEGDEAEKSKSLAKSKASVMAKLNHPGIVPLVGVSSHPNYGPGLIMELMSGDLGELITIRYRFSLHVSVDIILQIAEAMQYVHNAGFVHRDLRPNNILFKVVEDEQLSNAGFVVVKVAGFGTATESKEGELSENLELVGHPCYMAPEVHVPGFNIESVRMRNSNVVDVYSFGLVCYQIFSGLPPYDEWRSTRLMRRVRNGERPILPATCPPILASLIKLCWASDPNSRPDFGRICLELRHIKTMLITGSSSSINFQ